MTWHLAWFVFTAGVGGSILEYLLIERIVPHVGGVIFSGWFSVACVWGIDYVARRVFGSAGLF